MKYIIFLLIFINVSYSSMFGGNYWYDGKVKLILLENSSEANEIKNIALRKAINNFIIKNQNKSYFDRIDLQVKRNYKDILSIYESNYIDKERLSDALIDIFKKNKNYKLIIILTIDKDLNLIGFKLYNDGDKFVSKLKIKQTGKMDEKRLTSMVEFFIRSYPYGYKVVKRSGVSPIFYLDNNKIRVRLFLSKNIVLFNDAIKEKDIDLAYKLGLIKSDKISLLNAEQFCEIFDMSLPNKSLVGDDEYSYDMIYYIYDLIDDWIIRKQIGDDKNIKELDFRCMQKKDSMENISLKDYELNQIGLEYRLDVSKVHKYKVEAVFIKSANNFDSRAKLYSVLVSKDLVSLWKNNNLLSTLPIDIKKVDSVELDNNKIFINGADKNYNISINKNKLKIDSTNYNTDTLYVKHKKFYKNNVSKILTFYKNIYKVKSTFDSKLIFYKKSENTPIKTISNFGYSFLDIGISDDNNYLIASNLNGIVYIFNLNTIIDSTIDEESEK